jgi:hypothetical protein
MERAYSWLWCLATGFCRGQEERYWDGKDFRSRWQPRPEWRYGRGRANPSPAPTLFTVTPQPAQVARLVAGSLQALGPAPPMARTRNQYCVPLTSAERISLAALEVKGNWQRKTSPNTSAQ